MTRLSAWTIAALLAAPSLAHAHAHLAKAEPPAGAIVRTAPQQVEITFDAAVEPRFSTIVVTDSRGARIDKHDEHSVSGDPKRLMVSLGDLPPGAYTVKWEATSVDTHKTNGTYTFTVAP